MGWFAPTSDGADGRFYVRQDYWILFVIVADKIAEYLYEKGIRHVFTIVGAGNVQLLDALANQGKIRIETAHHEQAAVMEAIYYYRSCGIIAPVIVTIGAGSSNPITGVLAAWMDSIPVLIISGNEPIAAFRKPAPRVIGVQGYRSAEFARPITKYSAQAQTPADALTILDQCYRVALEPRQGPCWLDLPQDIARMEA